MIPVDIIKNIMKNIMIRQAGLASVVITFMQGTHG